VRIQLLDLKQHDRSNFSCEEESLIHYIQTQASQDMNKNLAACFVLLNTDIQVVGYYTLSNSSISRKEIPEEHQKKIPKNYDVPVTLLGRLARDIKTKGSGIGEYLLIDALQRSYTISQKSIASMAIVVDPINEKAVKFYLKYGFKQLPDSGKMFLPMKAIEKLFR
jgi:predicted GNAT family N-acyltransferase